MESGERDVFFWFGAVAIVAGVLFFASGIKKAIRNKLKYTERVTATCIRHEEMSDDPDLTPEERKELEEEEELEVVGENEGVKEIGEVRVTDGVVQAQSPNDERLKPTTAVYGFSLNGQTYEAREHIYSYPAPTIKVGDTCEILVNPKNPKEVYYPKQHRIDKISSILSGLACIVLGSLFIFVSLFGD